MAEESGKFQELELKLVDILKNSGIKDEIKEVNVTEPPELKGEHMATVTVYAQAIFKNPELKPKNIFVKLYSSNPVQTQMMREMKIMEKESEFFKSFLPAAQTFCKEYAGCESLINFFPRFIYGDDDIVVLDNMVLDDTYVMLPKEDFQDLYTAKMVLSNLAKFHAVSFAMVKKSGLEEFKNKWEIHTIEAFDSAKNPMMAQMFDNSLNTCLNMIKNYPAEGSEHTLKLFEGMMGKIAGELSDLLKNQDKTQLTVLNHGDCWNNNMLFKKDGETGKANDHIFIDLQLTRFGSPNLDIGYFLYTSVKPTVRRAHLVELLQHYYRQLSETLQLFDVVIPISFSEFFEDYKVHSKLGYTVSITFLSAIGALKDIDLESMPSDPQEMMEEFNNIINKWIQNNPQVVGNVVKELIAVVAENEKIQESKV